MKIDEILDEYRQGDADQRISLFLYHLELRDAFDKIEQEDPLDLFVVTKSSWVSERRAFRAFTVMLRELFLRFGSRDSVVKSKSS